MRTRASSALPRGRADLRHVSSDAEADTATIGGKAVVGSRRWREVAGGGAGPGRLIPPAPAANDAIVAAAGPVQISEVAARAEFHRHRVGGPIGARIVTRGETVRDILQDISIHVV